MERDDWVLKISKKLEKDQTVINVDSTHTNDNLVSKLGNIEVSGLFFFFFLKWLKGNWKCGEWKDEDKL